MGNYGLLVTDMENGYQRQRHLLFAGITDIFEIRYERPPYNLIKTRADDVPRVAKPAVADRFFDEFEVLADADV